MKTEARAYLQNPSHNSHEYNLAPNHFANNQKALECVDFLYSKGAVKVECDNWNPSGFDVHMPKDHIQRYILIMAIIHLGGGSWDMSEEFGNEDYFNKDIQELWWD